MIQTQTQIQTQVQVQAQMGAKNEFVWSGNPARFSATKGKVKGRNSNSNTTIPYIPLVRANPILPA